MLLQSDLLYGEEHVARALRCSIKTLQAWRHRGGGPPYSKLGRLVRYSGKDVRSWLDARTRRSTSES